MENPRSRHWTWHLLQAYMFGQVATGVFGALDPSPSLGYLNLVWLYSVGLVVCAVIGSAGLYKSPRAVMWSLYGMALTTLIHGLSIVLAGSIQTGARLLIAPLMMIPMAHVWWRQQSIETMLSRKEEG